MPTATIEVSYDPWPLRDAIAERGLTQRELAALRGCHYETINRALTGRGALGTTIEWLCDYLAVPRDRVFQPR